MTSLSRRIDLFELTEPVCVAHGVELVDVRLSGNGRMATVVVLIDKARLDGKVGSGIDIDDCKNVSRDLSTILDMHESALPAQYRLEVSSPGVERPLVRKQDYSRFAGQEVSLKSSVLIGQGDVKPKKTFRGVLIGLSESDVVQIDEGGVTFAIPFSEIEKANLVYRF